MSATKKPRRAYRQRPKVMGMVERAMVRSAWGVMERDLLALKDGECCAAVINGLCRIIAPAHTIAEDRHMDSEVIALLDQGMAALNRLVVAGALWDASEGETLADSGHAAQQIMAQASEIEQAMAVRHCIALAAMASSDMAVGHDG